MGDRYYCVKSEDDHTSDVASDIRNGWRPVRPRVTMGLVNTPTSGIVTRDRDIEWPLELRCPEGLVEVFAALDTGPRFVLFPYLDSRGRK